MSEDKPTPLEMINRLEALALHQMQNPSFRTSRYIPISSQIHEYRQQRLRKINLYKRMREALEEKDNG